jgi:polyribonucleotide nucleotidyltransferase
VKQTVCDPEIGEVFDAVVKTITDFGAFVEYLPGREGLIHISELDTKRVARTEDVVNMGDTVKVKIVGFDRNGKVRLSRKALLTA